MSSKCGFVAFLALLGLGLSLAQKQAPVLKDPPTKVLYRAGKPFELDCAVDSGDSSEITSYQWFRYAKKVDPKAAEQSGSRLIFKAPQNTDAGDYQCQATSSAGVASTKLISVSEAFLLDPQVSTKRVKPVEGKPFKLDCNVPSGHPKPTIEWKKQSVSDSSKSETILDGRITISDNGDLYFTNATQEDVSTDFKYVCVATTPAVDGEVILAEHIVEGLEKNPKPDHEVTQLYVTPNDATAIVGEKTFLYCIYGSSPQAYPDWYKDGVNVNNKPEDRVTRHNRSKGKRLLIKETLLEDEGHYTCVINNELGKPENYSFHLNVVSVPEFVKKPEKRVQAKEGDDLFLPCEVKAKPAAAPVWTLNAKPVAGSRRVVFSDKGLTINKVQKGDGGYYGCNATNIIGGNYVESYVQVV
ncbi:hemolin-like isoform X2 [Ostrinia furnacalis]|uniref:Hemolin n=2 Tax=Ostrinia furnacalis TaxID=93504 RepID=A0A8F3BNZ2_OSTFU|nr:hemolin-like isoform X2 [Ostrinia furnacalis]QWX20071.1 hemolin [Ostrinia furnacalis]